jgi:type II secretory pathway pseudopilin PulG
MSETGSDGFTLLETLAAVGVMAAVGVIAFPALQRAVAAAEFSEARAVLVSDLAVARALALRSGQPVAVTAAADGGGYSWTASPVRRLPEGLRLAERGGVAFFPDGSARPGELVMADASRRLRVTVSAAGVARVDPQDGRT